MAQAKILIIDDDHTIREMFKLALTRADFEVVTAPDGQVGLEHFRDDKPDLVVIDIAMPGIDGYQVVEEIRKIEAGERKTPLMILTAHETDVMRNYATELGADAYVTKPITPTILIETILSLIK
jgi:DNA-binding response OmpR family regulator